MKVISDHQSSGYLELRAIDSIQEARGISLNGCQSPVDYQIYSGRLKQAIQLLTLAILIGEEQNGPVQSKKDKTQRTRTPDTNRHS